MNLRINRPQCNAFWYRLIDKGYLQVKITYSSIILWKIIRITLKTPKNVAQIGLVLENNK